MIKKIFLDLDDVLNYLAPYILHRIGCKIGPRDYAGYPGIKCGYNIVEAANLLHPNKTDWTTKTFWNAIRRDIWASCPVSDEFRLLIDLSQRAVGENIKILTKAVNYEGCLDGKRDWMNANLPDWLCDKFVIVGDVCKDVAANSESLLIDDSDKNVEDFRKAGGQAILMPRPWNCLREVTLTESYLIDRFSKIFPKKQAA